MQTAKFEYKDLAAFDKDSSQEGSDAKVVLKDFSSKEPKSASASELYIDLMDQYKAVQERLDADETPAPSIERTYEDNDKSSFEQNNSSPAMHGPILEAIVYTEADFEQEPSTESSAPLTLETETEQSLDTEQTAPSLEPVTITDEYTPEEEAIAETPSEHPDQTPTLTQEAAQDSSTPLPSEESLEAKANTHIVDLLTSIQTELASLQQQQLEHQEKMLGHIVHISKEIAKKIIQKDLEEGITSRIEACAEACVLKLKQQEKIIVKINQNVINIVQDKLKDVIEHAGLTERVHFQPSVNLEVNSCMIEWQGGMMENLTSHTIEAIDTLVQSYEG